MILLIILTVSFLASLAVSLVYKFATNQKEMKRLREETERLQKEIKSIKDPQKALDVQKQAMNVSMEYSMKSMKPTFFTLIPLLLVFSWLSSTIAYEPLLPMQLFPVSVTFGQGISGMVTATSIPDSLNITHQAEITNGVAGFQASGPEGSYTINFNYDNITFSREVLVSGSKYLPPLLLMKSSDIKTTGMSSLDLSKSPVKQVLLGNSPAHPLGDIAVFGYRPGWLAVYILSSLVFSMALRKLMKLY